jgi:hypothetical protein
MVSCYGIAPWRAANGAKGSTIATPFRLTLQCLLNRLEVWRSLRMDGLAIAVRRLPSIVARIEMEMELSRNGEKCGVRSRGKLAGLQVGPNSSCSKRFDGHCGSGSENWASRHVATGVTVTQAGVA